MCYTCLTSAHVCIIAQKLPRACEYAVFCALRSGDIPDNVPFSVNHVPYDKRLAKKKKFQQLKSQPIKLNDESIIHTGIEKEQYIQLCRGIDLRPPSVTKDLICKYEVGHSAYYKYGPRKVEIVSYSPYIAVMHDFITPGKTTYTL